MTHQKGDFTDEKKRQTFCQWSFLFQVQFLVRFRVSFCLNSQNTFLIFSSVIISDLRLGSFLIKPKFSACGLAVVNAYFVDTEKMWSYRCFRSFLQAWL